MNRTPHPSAPAPAEHDPRSCPECQAPTPTALAAKAFMDRIGSDTYLGVIRTSAVNGGWVGARAAGCRDAKLSDAISEAAVNAVLDLFRHWAAEVNGSCPCGAPAGGDPR